MCKLQPNYAYTVNSVCCRFLSNQCVHYATRLTERISEAGSVAVENSLK